MSGADYEESREETVADRQDADSGPGPAGDGKPWPSELDEDEDEWAPSDARPEAPEPEKTGPQGEGRQKANTLNRVIARVIDILLALLLAELPGYIGFFAGLTYIGIADGLMSGRSIGKKIIGLRVLYLKDGKPADFRGSILRNSTIGLLYVLNRIPFVGWALAVLGLGFELLLIVGSPEGRRLGDEVAATVVVDEKSV